MVQCILMDGFEDVNQDIDLFFIGKTKKQFETQVHKFELKFKNKIVKKRIRNHLNELIIKLTSRLQLKFQFIYNRINRTTSKILNGFDMDIVQIAYTGTNLICTLSFMSSIKTNTFINYKLTNDIRDVGYYLSRCFKYMNRKFNWLVPNEYDENLAQMPLAQTVCFFDYGMEDFYRNVDSFEIQSKFVLLMNNDFNLDRS